MRWERKKVPCRLISEAVSSLSGGKCSNRLRTSGYLSRLAACYSCCYGIREAAEKLGVDRRIAMRAFKELQTAGFIRLADESLFNSRTGSKARSWVLTWLPYRDRPPTNDWERSKSSGT